MSEGAPYIPSKPTEILRLKIDDFEHTGPARVRVVTVPPDGDSAIPVYDDWLDGERLEKQLPAGLHFPLKARGWRYPMAISRVISAETKKPVDPDDKSTWPTVALKCGAVHKTVTDPFTGKRQALCHHKPKCPPPIDLTDGIILNDGKYWVLRQDGPPIPEDQLEEIRAREEADRRAPAQGKIPETAAATLGPKSVEEPL